MFSNIRLTNFKAFDNLGLDIRPLTFILGPNNSGKSSILAAPRMLAQTMRSYDSGISLLLNGDMGDFGTYRDVVYMNDRRRQFSIGVEIKISEGLNQRQYFMLNQGGTVRLKLHYMYRSIRREVILKKSELLVNNQRLITTDYSNESERQIIGSVGEHAIPAKQKSTLSNSLRMRNFLPDHLFITPSGLSNVSDDVKIQREIADISRNIHRASYTFFKYLDGIEYIGAMRQPPSRTYLFSGESRSTVGVSGQYATSILVMDSIRGGSKSKRILEDVKKWLMDAKIASDIKIISLSDRHYEMHLQNPFTGEYQNYADVGYGNSQVIPVLVAGYNLQPGSTLIVEEPEIHLHPRAQSELGDFFLSLYKRHIQAIVETHSEYLVLRIQQQVALGKIPPDEICFYYVTAKQGHKEVVKMTLDKQGKFVGEWPEGFFPERLEEARKLAQIRLL